MGRAAFLAAIVLLCFPPGFAGAEELKRLGIAGKNGMREFRVEIADTDAERLKGLQGRKTLPPGQGMLFLYQKCQPLSFWMKDTPISLDMAFLDRDGAILDIEAKTEPYSLDGISPPGDAFAVLEVGAGVLAARGIEVGDRVDHHSLHGAPCK